MYSRASGLLTAIFKADGSHWLFVANRKPKARRRRQALAVINVNESIALGTLGSGIVVLADSDGFDREFFAISADLYWSMKGNSGAEGPIEVGISHGDYTVTEIKENLDLTGMEDPSDLVAIEQGRRKIRRSARFQGTTTAEVLNDGKMIRTRLKFALVGSGPTLAFWAHNLTVSTLTTGIIVDVQGKIYGRWM